MSFLFDALYLIEPLPVLADHLRARVDPGLAEVLLEPILLRRREGGNSDWRPADGEAIAKLLFLASLREYTGLETQEEFSAAFGEASVSVNLFDRWYRVRRFQIDNDMEQLEPWLRDCPFRIFSTGRFLVDQWLAGLRGRFDTNSESDVSRESH